MANNSEDIRRIMNLLEDANTSEPSILEEGVLDNLRNAINRRLGNKEREKLTSRLTQEWSKWLGQTDREGTIDDMERFMKLRIGFTEEDIDTVMRTVLKTPAKKNDADGRDQDENPDDEEDGTPLPKDLNAKLSDYDKVHQKSDPDADEEVVEDDPEKYMSNGKLDNLKILQKLNNLPAGTTLKLGNREFYLEDDVNEDIITEKGPTVLDDLADKNSVLSKQQIQDFFNKAAAYINDEYLTNATRQRSGDTAKYNDAPDVPGRGYDGRGMRSPVGRNGGVYDRSLMRDALEREGLSIHSASRLLNKAQSTRSVSELSDQDMHTLAMIGYAFAKSRIRR